MAHTDALIAGLPIPIMIIDSAYKIKNINAPLKELFAFDVRGMKATALLRQAPVLAAMDTTMRQKVTGNARFIFSGISGEVIYSFQSCPLEHGAILSFEDRTQAEAGEMIRRDFVSNISHELRTPLTGLIGFIETLRGPARDDSQARERFLSIMEEEAHRMSRMVSDLLSLSRVEIDERVRPRNMVNLDSILRSVVATLEGKLKQNGCEVVLKGLDHQHMIRGDRDQLIQLFLNLLENAIKYGGSSQEIHVEISKIKRDLTLRQPAMQVCVCDQGEGIDPIHIPRLTERFYRVDDDRSREKGGTGLGLAIVKHIINRHRGRLKISSKQGVGSCFSVILPLENKP